jgi:arginase
MELAIVTGFGPPGLVDLAGPPPLIEPSDVVVLGYRDGDLAENEGSPNPSVVAPKIHLYDARSIQQLGPDSLGAEVEANLAAQPGRFWLHLDLDVLDKEILPAVDYKMSGGLDWDEVAKLVSPLAQSSRLVGADVTILNPNLDPDNRYAKQVVRLLSDLFVV